MIVSRDLFSSPPRARTKAENNPTLLVSWWCTGFALAIIIVRIGGRYVRTEKLFREDKIMAWSIIPLLTRMALVHVILIWGTNNAITTGLTDLDIQHRETGSKLVLASRIMYAAFLWVAKFTISEFLKRLTQQVWKRSYEMGLQCIRWFLVVTFIGVVIATLAECQPFPNYWQVVPDPGPNCRQGHAQLITMGSADIVTDLLLVCFPIPIILKSAMAIKRKVSLVLLFGLSLILVGITSYRIAAVIDRHADQRFRSLLASLEILAAAAISNALVLGSFVRDRGVKKQRFRFGSVGGNSSMNASSGARKGIITARTWGSEADLVGDMGIRCNPELSVAETADGYRRAPLCIPTASHAKALTPNPANKDMMFRGRRSDETDDTDLREDIATDVGKAPNPADVVTPRKMSFFDVGGLLDARGETPSPRRPVPTYQSHGSNESVLPPHSDEIGDELAIHHTRQGPNAELLDVGNLLATEPRAPEITPAPRMRSFSRSSPSGARAQEKKPAKVSLRKEQSGNQLQDVGGLLS